LEISTEEIGEINEKDETLKKDVIYLRKFF